MAVTSWYPCTTCHMLLHLAHNLAICQLQNSMFPSTAKAPDMKSLSLAHGAKVCHLKMYRGSQWPEEFHLWEEVTSYLYLTVPCMQRQLRGGSWGSQCRPGGGSNNTCVDNIGPFCNPSSFHCPYNISRRYVARHACSHDGGSASSANTQ